MPKDLRTASLCFLSYERPKFIKEAIKSATYDPAFDNYEIILHDDGSNHVVQEELMSVFRSGLFHIDKFIANPPGRNEGVGNAIKTCFDIAKGDVLFKLDQDLIFKDRWLKKSMDIMNSNQNIALLGLFHYHHDPVDTAKCKLQQREGWQIHSHICGSGFGLSRKAYERFGINTHSEAFAEDWELMQKINKSVAWYNALPDEDLVENRGFGIGPSTVVMEDGSVRGIHKARI